MENNSKQAVLSIVGIAILVIAVVGVSFAFFTYSRTGEKNNVITTGSLTFKYWNEQNGLTLTNQFPQSDEEGAGNAKFTFDVTGQIPAGAQAINYRVYAIPGTAVEGKTRFQDSEISYKITGSTDEADGTAPAIQGTFADAGVATGTAGGSETVGTGLLLATGTIPNTGAPITHSYSMTMWVNDTVTISDTNEATYRAAAITASTPAGEKANSSKEVFSNLYYSFKIRVDADDSI